jgi:hypothetical protein
VFLNSGDHVGMSVVVLRQGVSTAPGTKRNVTVERADLCPVLPHRAPSSGSSAGAPLDRRASAARNSVTCSLWFK